MLEDLDTDPRTLTAEDREKWHLAQELAERQWLDQHIRSHLRGGDAPLAGRSSKRRFENGPYGEQPSA